MAKNKYAYEVRVADPGRMQSYSMEFGTGVDAVKAAVMLVWCLDKPSEVMDAEKHLRKIRRPDYTAVSVQPACKTYAVSITKRKR